MSDRTRRFYVLRRWYRLWTGVMLVSLAAVVFGIPVAIWQRSAGTGMVAYGILSLILCSSFYFIVRTRYKRSKLAHDARTAAHAPVTRD